MVNYYSVQSPIENQIEIKKSRFITYLFPIKTEEEFNDHLAVIRKEHYKANHLCQAFILGENSMIQRMSDDGEPSGTAGVPMLEVFKQQELTFLMAVVVRYFGGIKLGSGGLIRAYSQAVSEALKHATIVQNINQTMVSLTLSYAQVDPFQYYLNQTTDPATLIDTQYTDQVTFTLAVNSDQVAEVEKHLTERFNGQLTWQVTGEQQLDVPVSL